MTGPLLLGTALLAVWVRVELRRTDPLVDVRALDGRQAGPFYLASASFGVVYFAAQAPDTMFLAADPHTTGYGFGMSSTQISLVLLPAIVAAIIGSAVTVPLGRRIGYRSTLASAFVLVMASFLALAALHDSVVEIVTAKIIAGLGLGIALSAMPTVIVEAAERSRSGVATALYNGGGLMAAVLATSSHGTGAPTSPEAAREGAYVVVWLMCAAGAAPLCWDAVRSGQPDGLTSGDPRSRGSARSRRLDLRPPQRRTP
ncbi:MFS transporter [Streptomyces sp. NPDC059193]|uniref:MFS transporter n=1 Tax=Streptomyces sp. NPDC059193 TaxID=3346763 RepID=UPI0036C35848